MQASGTEVKADPEGMSSTKLLTAAELHWGLKLKSVNIEQVQDRHLQGF